MVFIGKRMSSEFLCLLLHGKGRGRRNGRENNFKINIAVCWTLRLASQHGLFSSLLLNNFVTHPLIITLLSAAHLARISSTQSS